MLFFCVQREIKKKITNSTPSGKLKLQYKMSTTISNVHILRFFNQPPKVTLLSRIFFDANYDHTFALISPTTFVRFVISSLKTRSFLTIHIIQIIQVHKVADFLSFISVPKKSSCWRKLPIGLEHGTIDN